MHLSVFDLASPQSGQLLWLWSVCMWVCGFVLACVTIPILYIVVRYRARGAGEPPQIAGNKQLEIIRTVVPLALAGLLFVLSITAARAVDRPVTREPDLIVTGHQWWWALTYPAANATTAHEIHVPVGRNMLIGIEAADVIADFCLSRLTRTIGPSELTAPPPSEGRSGLSAAGLVPGRQAIEPGGSTRREGRWPPRSRTVPTRRHGSTATPTVGMAAIEV